MKPEPPPLNDLDRRYRAWRSTHQAVMEILKQAAQEFLDRKKPFGFRMIVERARWLLHMYIEKDPQGFRLNDHYTPYLARDLIRQMPELSQFVELRQVRGDRDQEGLMPPDDDEDKGDS